MTGSAPLALLALGGLLCLLPAEKVPGAEAAHPPEQAQIAAADSVSLQRILDGAEQAEREFLEKVRDYICQARTVISEPREDDNEKKVRLIEKTIYRKLPLQRLEKYHTVIENGQALSPQEAAERQKKQTWNAAVAGRNFFRPEHRRHYAFELLPPDSIDGRPAHVLSIQPRPGGRNLVSGTIWLHRDNFEILRLDVRPTDRPRFVNKLRMIIDFDEVDNGVWLPVRIDADACGGFLFFNRCLRVHEEWGRFQINAGLPDSIFASTEP